MAGPTRPALRYHGGKWRVAPWVISHFPPHKVYVEPFSGAASVLLRKPRADVEYFNDLDGEVVNLFRVLRDRGAELEELLRLTPFAREEFAESYESTDDPLERARRTVVRAQMGFGTSALVRNKTGWRCTSHRNKKKGYASDWATYPDAVGPIVERLRGVHIENCDALELIPRLDQPAALFYCDPPYVHATRDRVHGTNGYRHELTDADHEALAAVLHNVEGAVVLSGYDSPLYSDLFGEWLRVDRPTNGQGPTGAVERLEVLWLNPRAAAGQVQGRLFA